MNPTSESFDQPTQTGNDQATPVAKTGGKKLTGKQKAALFAGLGGAAAIAGGSAFAWGMSEEDGKANNTHPETKPATETPSKVEEPKPSTETPSDSTHVSTNPRPEVTPNATPSSQTTPSENETSNSHEPMVATHVTDDMSFEDAFKTARAEVGPGGYFEWNDHLYNTYYKEEWEAMTEKQREEYAASLQDETGSTPIHTVSNEASQPDIKVGEYNGHTVALGDVDHDGDSEVIVIDGTSGAIDRDNDGIMETRVEFDPETHKVTAQTPLATTFEAPKMSALESNETRLVSNETASENKPDVVTTEYQGHTIVAGDTDHDGDAEVVIVDGTSGAVDTDNDGILETRVELDPNSHELIASAPMTDVYRSPALSDFGTSQNQSTPSSSDTTPEVEVVTVSQDGHDVKLGDSNQDGYVDIVMLEDGKTVIDVDGDHQFDTVAQVNMETGEVLTAAPLEHPFEAPTMDSFSSDENRMASNDYDNNADVSDWVA
ncbi:hypothetical protein [Larkinella terrae]|uniref:Uncharacterized protein n=1 Tax=Larkinella terrae TaxID=2025311 RepID=A0A7K0EPZ8_9BACT|nr:hypothetical protein [Larkinella terrae]MRS63488.1 hypothetical protein [Larkinella terrae]